MKTSVILTLILSGTLAVAAPEHGDDAAATRCETDLSAPTSGTRASFTIVPSDRVPSDAEKYRDYVRELTEPGGVLDQLGIAMTGQIVEFLQGKDLQALTSGTSGGYPVSFYLDGASVLNSLKPKSGFALEVVYPGPQFQHGFYRDDNPEAQQMSILDHVVGHNNFAYSSGLAHYRAAQGLLASRELDDVLTTLYKSYNKEEVQHFYLWSMTLSRLMDWYTPYYEGSDKFEPKLEVKNWDPLGRTKPLIRRHPKVPTENVLPAFAANIAPHQPEWKRRILDLVHDSMAFRPALVHTQIMNEGWASIMQEIIPRHTKRNHHFAYWLNASQVMQTEATPNLRDPYSLGVFSWRRLRERFEQRPEIAALKTQLEKDRAFIQYADDEIIGRMDDSQFLRLAMDQVFVDRYKLAIVRMAAENEQDPNLPPPQNPQQPVAQWIVVSRDAEKVAAAVIDMVLKPKYMYNPRVKLVDFTRPESGEVELVIDDEVGNSLPIALPSLAPSLYALSQIIDKAVSLECMTLAPQSADGAAAPGANQLPPLGRMRVAVSPQGEVHAYRLTPNGTGGYHEDADPALNQQLSLYLGAYIQDLYLEDPDEMGRIFMGSQSLSDLIPKSVSAAVEDTPYDSLVSHAPNAAGAIAEYKAMVERRMLKALELSSASAHGVRMVGGAPRVKALPSPMNIEFDMRYAQMAKQAAPGAPVDSFRVVPQSAVGEYEGASGQVGGIDGNPGDRFWGPGGGGGAGGKPVQPGEDDEDLSWVEVPSDLYSQFLGERVKLPRLNPKPGLSRVKKTKPGRRINRMWGQMLPSEILENAHKRGYARVLREGGDPDLDADATIDQGFDELQPRDWVVKSKTVARKPEVKAVVTFVLDASGSTARYMESFKRFVHDIETLIAANYKGFDFRYIIFDTKAHVMKDKRDFFRAQLGGGTEYHAGLVKAHELMSEEYPRNVWDRFTFLMGDMEDFSPDKAFGEIREILEDSEYMGVVAGLNGGDDSPYLQLLRQVRSEAASNPQIGLTVLDQDGGYRIENIREVLKNDEDGE